MTANNRVIIAMIAIAALAVAFWMLLLSPKRAEVDKLDGEAAQQRESLSLHREEAQRGREAERAFPREYQQLVILGKAAPADDDTASLLVQLNRIAGDARIRFQAFELTQAGEEGATEESSGGGSAEGEELASPTEVAASTLPLGASIGPAGLAVMPYKLNFEGSFFHIAEFIHGLDSLVQTKNSQVEVTGRLITLNGFSLKPDESKGLPFLKGEFTVTTFLVPPGQGVTAGATPTSPEPSTTQVSTTTGGTP